MKLVIGSQVATTTKLRLRKGPGVSFETEAILEKDVIAVALENPVNRWVKVFVTGYTIDGKTVYSEPHTSSSIKLTRSVWFGIRVVGYLSTGYLKVIDGPTEG